MGSGGGAATVCPHETTLSDGLMLAIFIPAQRATRVDHVAALRAE